VILIKTLTILEFHWLLDSSFNTLKTSCLFGIFRENGIRHANFADVMQKPRTLNF